MERYKNMKYRRLGRSGLLLPVISLGLWNNFGKNDSYENAKNLIWTAFNNGITHFDLANNYGPDPGYAELTFGKILKEGLIKYRDEIIISTKAGFTMWPGPYGDYGSRKYLIASLNQSLKRMGIEYVDIFYHHRPDSETDIRETMTALADIVRMGKALYIGLSNYSSEEIKLAVPILQNLNVPFVISQPSYSMMNRWIEEDGLLNTLEEYGAGAICFHALAQGLLTERYLKDIPKDSRALNPDAKFLNKEHITEELRCNLRDLNSIAAARGQTLAQMSIAWALRDSRMTSVLIGASKPEQILENIKSISNTEFSHEELKLIDRILDF